MDGWMDRKNFENFLTNKCTRTFLFFSAQIHSHSHSQIQSRQEEDDDDETTERGK